MNRSILDVPLKDNTGVLRFFVDGLVQIHYYDPRKETEDIIVPD